MSDMQPQRTEGRFVTAIIGEGQGGTSFASCLAREFAVTQDHIISANLSSADFKGSNFVSPNRQLLLDPKGFGSGKNRDYAKNVFIPKKDTVIDKFCEFTNDCNLIFVVFSAGGGTGSGLGPITTALLQQKLLEQHKQTLVYGIALLPDASEGELSQDNATKLLNEITKIVEGKIARFFLVDNASFGNMKKDIEKWDAINNMAAKFLRRYIVDNYIGSRGNLDQNDRFTALNATGVHALASYRVEEGNRIKIISPFVLPEGANVRYQTAEVPNGQNDIRKQIALQVGAIVNDDTFVGYYEKSEGEKESTALASEFDSPFPIVHFAGFSNLGKVIDRHSNWFTQMQMKSQAASEIDREKAMSADLLKVNSEIVSGARTLNTVSSEAILDILG